MVDAVMLPGRSESRIEGWSPGEDGGIREGILGRYSLHDVVSSACVHVKRDHALPVVHSAGMNDLAKYGAPGGGDGGVELPERLRLRMEPKLAMARNDRR
ncbi:hypothetical protein D7193_12105 [Micromonospora costi]|uniref:Uncharacterized protein n=1 Tax=Micromonospora costi TaxID=1530042 RepID=A0A3B0A773_9ACTN|nr:hypothetical protein D7193_12105 [Micromonospora costi]